LPTLDINERNPTVDGSEDMPVLRMRREEGAAGEMVVRNGRRIAGFGDRFEFANGALP